MFLEDIISVWSLVYGLVVGRWSEVLLNKLVMIYLNFFYPNVKPGWGD